VKMRDSLEFWFWGGAMKVGHHLRNATLITSQIAEDFTFYAVGKREKAALRLWLKKEGDKQC